MKKITTRQGFGLLRLIKEIGLKDKVIANIKNQIKFEKTKSLIINKMYAKCEEDLAVSENKTIELFMKNSDIYEQYKEVEEEQGNASIDFMDEVYDTILDSEELFYKHASSVFNITEEEMQELDIMEAVLGIFDIFKSKSFMGLLNVMNN